MTTKELLWYLAVFGTTAYAVFWLGRDGAWFILAFIVAGSI